MSDDFDEVEWNSHRVALEKALVKAVEDLSFYMGSNYYTIPYGNGQVIKVRPDEE